MSVREEPEAAAGRVNTKLEAGESKNKPVSTDALELLCIFRK